MTLLKAVNWKVFLVLFVAGLLGVVAILPFAVDLLPALAVDRQAVPEIPWPLIVGLALFQNGILLAIAIAIGLSLSSRIGLRMPLITSWVTGEPGVKPVAIVQPGLVVGAAVGAVLVCIEAGLFLRHLPGAMLTLFEIPLWKRLLAGVLYGGITEELLMRLCLVSTVAWLLGRRWKTPAGTPTPGVFWTAIILVAILFGLGHLPTTAAITSLTPLLIVRALVLNGVAGVAFGYLYWKHGLEAAMLAHMSTHLVMQAPGVMLLKGLL